MASNMQVKDAAGVTRRTRTVDVGTGEENHIQYNAVLTGVPNIEGGHEAADVTASQSLPNVAGHTNATHALLSVDTGSTAIRYRRDATAPTNSPAVGHVVDAGGYVEFAGGLANVRIVAATGTARVQVTYYSFRDPAV